MLQNKINWKLHWVLLIAMVAGFSLLTARLFHLQAVAGEKYRNLADDNRFFRQAIPAQRGVFLDRYLQPLVYNKKYYFKSSEAGKIFSQREPISREEALQLLAANPAQISWELRRLYRYPTVLAHVLGYTSPATKNDLLENRELSVTDWIGKMGLEQYAQDQIKGEAGFQIYEIDTMGQKQRVLERMEPSPGQNLTTSLDPFLSKVAFQALGQNQGSVIIMDVQTGQVLSLVSKPSFNSNDLSFALTEEKLEQQRQHNLHNYFTDERNVFFNRAVSGTYAPGSIFKIVTALAGLDSEAIDASTKVVDEGVLEVKDYRYANWYYTQYGQTEGEIGLKKAIARSNDIFFYKAAEWTGPDTLAQHARNLGFGQATNIPLSGEGQGLVPDPEWKEQEIGERWYLGNTYHYGIGQGDMLVTPLQIAQLTQTVANQGEMCQPQLFANTERVTCKNVGLNEQHLDLVLTGMLGACSPGGTAFPLFAYAQEAGIEDLEQALQVTGAEIETLIDQGALACKTGTAEFGGLTQEGYRKTHGWLVAVVGVNTQSLAAQASQLPLEDKLHSSQNFSQVRDDTAKTDSNSKELGSKEPTADNHEREQWLKQVAEHGFPEQLVIVALVESDENELYKEGSEHAGPVVAEIVDWIRGK